MVIKVRVKPGSRKREVLDTENGLVVKVCSPPEKGKANEELREILARYFGVSKGKVKIIKGEKSREKLIEIEK